MTKNKTIREKASAYNIRLWEIADKLGIRDSEFSRLLRHELTEKDKERVLAAIDEIRKERLNESTENENR